MFREIEATIEPLLLFDSHIYDLFWRHANSDIDVVQDALLKLP